jgi:hypothetical protein
MASSTPSRLPAAPRDRAASAARPATSAANSAWSCPKSPPFRRGSRPGPHPQLVRPAGLRRSPRSPPRSLRRSAGTAGTGPPRQRPSPAPGPALCAPTPSCPPPSWSRCAAGRAQDEPGQRTRTTACRTGASPPTASPAGNRRQPPGPHAAERAAARGRPYPGPRSTSATRSESTHTLRITHSTAPTPLAYIRVAHRRSPAGPECHRAGLELKTVAECHRILKGESCVQ